MEVSTPWMTVEEFAELDLDETLVYELHHGEVVGMTRPKLDHSVLQADLLLMLADRLAKFGRALIELAYRPVSEFELRVADVALVSSARLESGGRPTFLQGAPELVIEVKSPSNTKAALKELAALCLLNGSLEFWVVDPEARTITVTLRDGTVGVYRQGDQLPLDSFVGKPWKVDLWGQH